MCNNLQGSQDQAKLVWTQPGFEKIAHNNDSKADLASLLYVQKQALKSS